MRLITFVSMMIASLGFSTASNAPLQSVDLNGAWVPVRQEFGGNPLPAASFATQKLIVSDSTYTFTAESVDKGVMTYSNGKMDIYGREGVNKGKHFQAIYKYENEELSICYNLLGNAYPDAFDTKNKPMFFLSVFKKMKN